ncbi:hypothetical protein FO519_008799, partial [Halicephalobus sp. NKZ332]
MIVRGIFLLAFFVFFSGANRCPEKCNCGNSGGSRIDCSSRGLALFPVTKFSKKIHFLDLRHNFIQRLPIQNLQEIPFCDTIILGGNKLNKLEENFLDVLPALRRFYAGKNDLLKIPILASRPTSSLRIFDVHGNRLTNINIHAFDQLKDLDTVNVGHNNLQTVPDGIFEENKKLKTLNLAHNPWNCDCRLSYLVKLLRENPHLEQDHHAKCMHPESLRGRRLAELDEGDLQCAIPEFTPTAGGYLLTCTNSKDSIQSVDWLYRDVLLEYSVVEDYEVIDNGSLAISQKFPPELFKCGFNYITSPLRQSRQLSPVRQQDHLWTLNEAPSSESAPRFTYTPRDRSFREGSSVKLNCEVVGNPRPQIRWHFNGRILEPSRKFEMRNENTQLIIYPFLDQDIGEYKCEAFNHYGRIETKANIKVIRSSPPVIIDPPRSLEARVGEYVTFRCSARGEPKPFVTWFFNGSEIPILKGHFSVSDDTFELHINQVNRQDQGLYSCMAGNSVGSMTAEASLKVKFSQLDRLDKTLDEATLKNIVSQASKNVDRAIQKTKDDLKRGVTNPYDLLRHFKFASQKPVELTRAREIYEESLRLIEKHVELGIDLNPADMPKNLSFESVLQVSHIQTIMELSGCMNGQFKDSCSNMCFHSKYRSYTGQCNNFDHPTWGVSQMPFHRLLPPMYENGFNTPVGWDPNRLYYGFRKPNPRTVSLELVGTPVITPHHRFSAMVMQWGQFLDHDITFFATALARQTYMTGAICNKTCENVDPCFNIPLPLNDPKRREQRHMKFPCIEFERSAAICGSGETSPIFQQITHREQVNIITSFIDASNVYGSTEVDALDLRDLFSDHGLLRFDIVSASQKPYMPFEKDSGMDCRRNRSVDNPIRCFLAGDFRANEQLGLTAMHTLWFREHNRIAAKLLEMNADWDGERIYQETRKIIGAMMQHITYEHWLPLVLGPDGFEKWIGKYKGYDPNVNPNMANEFATAAFRFGHTLINPKLERLGKDFNTISSGPILLHEAFFAPERMLSEGGIDPLLRGLFASPLKKPLSHQLLNKELTEKLFHRSTNVALDLAAMNIQRGRDHALQGYLEYRRFCNLSVPDSWEKLQLDFEDQTIISKL